MRTPEQWESLVGAVARTSPAAAETERLRDLPPEARTAFAEQFRDDLGHRRLCYAPVIAWTLDVEPTQPVGESGPDIRAWHALASAGPRAVEIPEGNGALCESLAPEGIETWTEAEFSLLHALWWRASKCTPARDRAVSAARWLMAELQPDNATNRPWAVAVFAQLASEGDESASLYAETLIHNCQTQLGRPDGFSAVLLLDAVRRLQGR